MLRLSATTRINGTIVDIHDADLAASLWIGDLPDTPVGFPGAVFKLEPCAGGVKLIGGDRPVTILPGGTLELDLSERVPGLSIELCIVERAHLQREQWYLGDMRLLVVTLAVVLFGMWVDTLERWARTNPDVAAELEALPALWNRYEPARERFDTEPTLRAPEVTFQD